MTVDELSREALRLDHAGRAKLAHDLLDGLDVLSESEIEQLWLQEAVRRHAAIVAGEVETIPGDEVLAQARAARMTREIQAFPESSPISLAPVRTKVLSALPFSVIYWGTDEVIIVLAMAHHRRRLEYWRDRE